MMTSYSSKGLRASERAVRIKAPQDRTGQGKTQTTQQDVDDHVDGPPETVTAGDHHGLVHHAEAPGQRQEGIADENVSHPVADDVDPQGIGQPQTGADFFPSSSFFYFYISK